MIEFHPVLIGLDVEFFLVFIPGFQGVVEKAIIKKIEFSIYDLECVRIDRYFFAR